MTRPHHSDSAFPAAGREFEAVAVEIETLHALWPNGETAERRAEIGRSLDRAYTRLGELYGVITNTEAHTLPGAAVKLRRGLALMDTATRMDFRELETGKRLVVSALAVVERCAVRSWRMGVANSEHET